MDQTKQRTRGHVIADLSVHHVEGFVLRAGHTLQRMEKDYGYDALVFTFDERGYTEPGMVSLQLKASQSLSTVGTDFVFDLDVRDYHKWLHEKWPVILNLYDASRSRAYWVDARGYFKEDPSRAPKSGAKTVRVRVPKRQVVNAKAVAGWRDLKQ